MTHVGLKTSHQSQGAYDGIFIATMERIEVELIKWAINGLKALSSGHKRFKGVNLGP